MSEGTSTRRTRKASTSTAAPSATPNILMASSGVGTKDRKTLVMIVAATTTTRPDPDSPRSTAWRLSCETSHSSRMRLTRKTW